MIKTWLTKFHIYLGLFFVVDLWLFALSGLFLNHPHWRVNDYRAETQWQESTAPVTPAAGADVAEKARHYAGELHLEGELLGVREVKKEGESEFRFDVHTPGTVTSVTINQARSEAKIRKKANGFFGTLNGLHIFNGMERFSPGKKELTWYATGLWVVTMDALVAGLIVMILSGFYMWIQTGKLWSGAISLALGTAFALLFLFL